MRRPRVSTQLATLLGSIGSLTSSQPRPYFYTALPASSPLSGATGLPDSWRSRRSIAYRSKAVRLTLSLLILLTLSATSLLVLRPPRFRLKSEPFRWDQLERINGYYHGIRTLVPPSDYIPEYPPSDASSTPPTSGQPTFSWPSSAKSRPTYFNETDFPEPIIIDPYPDYTSADYLSNFHPVSECYLDSSNTTRLPDVFGYPGIPQHQTAPAMGSYQELGLVDDVCVDRFGRLGPYGLGYGTDEGGVGVGTDVESEGSDHVWNAMGGRRDWRGVDWHDVQDRCVARNGARFTRDTASESDAGSGRRLIPRTAVVLRTWTGFDYGPHVVLFLRAMINELALKSGGEYGVHLLVHVKDNDLPIWASEAVYQEVLRRNVPEEFRGLATLWSERQMEPFYPGPFEDNVENRSGGPIHGVYRSGHMILQYFAIHHPEYEFFWNWEMDVRYTGHYYELFERLREWARRQPRKNLWERNARYYVPAFHGSWEQFSQTVERETRENGEEPVWGPVPVNTSGILGPPNFATSAPELYGAEESTMALPSSAQAASWGVGEEADLITLNPIFDPNGTRWGFARDVTGYNRSYPIPPRRTAIMTATRLSRRLLRAMHEANALERRIMFVEMWPPSVALHHGLKAVYAPHPIYVDRRWPIDVLARTFNGAKGGTTGGNASSVFGDEEHNHQGTSWYYNSGFSPALWRRWLGYRENSEGGFEEESKGEGRMCLRSVLMHPIKHEVGPV